MADLLPSIPSVSEAIPTEIKRVLVALRLSMLALSSGDNPVARMSTLKDTGVIVDYNGPDITPVPAADFTPPPAPTNLTAAGALANIMLAWDPNGYQNIAYAEIWRAQSNSFAAATLIGTSTATVYADAIGAGATRYYWIRYVSKANIQGPFNAAGGTVGVTAYDASYLLDVLAANPPTGASYNPLLYVQATSIIIDGVTIPAGVYMTSAYIRALSVTNAQIANLAVDNAKIANLNAVKINAGDIDAARIQANIVTALVGKYNTLSALTASLGTIEINTGGYLRTEGVTSYTNGTGFWLGQVGGLYKMRVGNPAGNYLQWDGTNLTITGNISASTGDFRGQITGGAYTGYAWPAAGNYGFYLGASGLLLGNANNGKYFQVTYTGDIYAPGFTIVGGAATFSGALSAASGTFSGTLTAGAINAVNTINIAGNAVTLTSAANGTTSATLVMTSTGGPVQILAQGLGDQTDGVTTTGPRITVTRDGADISHGAEQGNIFLYLDNPGAGSHTYVVTLAIISGTSWATSPITFLSVLETKR